MWAIYAGHFFNISLLLVSQQGRSALFVAAERGYEKVVQILVKSGEKNDVLDEVVIYIAAIMRLFVECNMIVSSIDYFIVVRRFGLPLYLRLLRGAMLKLWRSF